MIATNKKLFESLGISLQDYCSCGRTTSAIHCPFCGSTDVRVSKRESKLASILLPGGGRKQVDVFNCRRCAKSFQENDCFHDCRAFVVNWRSEQRTVEQVEEQVKKSGPIPPTMREALVALAKKHPKYRQTIQDKLAEQGPGLLERVDIERGRASVPEPSALEIADRERAAAKLFQPAVASDEEEERK